MALFDIVVLVLLAVMAIRGGISGIVAQILSIVALILSWLLAANCYGLAGKFLPADATWNKPVAMLLVFIAASIGLKIATSTIRGLVRKTVLREFDRQLGALLGCVKGFALCLVITFFCVTMSDSTCNAVAKSRSGKYLVAVINRCAAAVPNDEEHTALRARFDQFRTTTEENGMTASSASLRQDVHELKEKLNTDILSPESAEAVRAGQREESARSSSTTFESLANSFNQIVDQWRGPTATTGTPAAATPAVASTDMASDGPWNTGVTSSPVSSRQVTTATGYPGQESAAKDTQNMNISFPLPDLGTNIDVQVPLPDRETLAGYIPALTQWATGAITSTAPTTTTPTATAPAVVSPAVVSGTVAAPTPAAGSSTAIPFHAAPSLMPSYNSVLTEAGVSPVLSSQTAGSPTR